MIESIQAESAQRTAKVRVCSRRGAPDEWVRFIPASDDTVLISSTEIRDIITTCPSHHLYERLESIALHPEILVELVQHRRRGESRLRDPGLLHRQEREYFEARFIWWSE